MKAFARNKGRFKTHVYDGATKAYVCAATVRQPVRVSLDDVGTGMLCWTCTYTSIVNGYLVLK